MKAELTHRLEMAPSHPDWKEGVKQWLEPGTILEHRQAYLLVRQGCAKPADDECEKAAAMNNTQRQQAQKAYNRLARGIHPDDFEAFDEGLMTGYDPETGEWLPGPNHVEDE